MSELLEPQENSEDMNWLLKWLLGAFLTILLAVGAAWASGIGSAVADHEKRIIVQEQNSKNIENKLDEILVELKEQRRRNAR